MRPAVLALILAGCHGRDAEPRATATAPAPGPTALDVDVPRLVGDAATLPVGTDRIEAIRDVGAIPHFDLVPVLAIDRGLPALATLDALRTHGADAIRLLVLAGDARRLVEIDVPRASAGDPTVFVLLDVKMSVLVVDGQVVAPAQLQAKLSQAGHIMLHVEADVTVQRLAEVASLAGGLLDVSIAVLQPMPMPPRDRAR